ncbi:TonB-dependent receptor domain-containing protein [Sphingomonas mucosissima]|uniref:Vitamin B12 transporter BtuB n=1 Tax=Sphingomonas mucosissima TaxID=370959 RepID=A0A245ZE09_9SPHN|nr:TonB-dependent receptor [Sphingomonas mucosissima]OWK27990.1 vitamin B12 transporter BtuB precursor [Sphingomonas mucosissima]
MKKVKALALLGASTLACLAAVPASAQDAQARPQPPADPAGVIAPATADEPTAGGGDIVITGSRIARRDFTAESPIATVDEDFIKNAGPTTVEQALNVLPQFQATQGAQTTSTAIGGPTASGGRSNANLRGLGTARTLVLFDGRRLQPSDALGGIDLNTISSALISSVETITGGASAVYGSDAVAGVVNFRFNNRFRGFEVEFDGGVTEQGDGTNYQGSLTWGGATGDDRARLFLSLSYLERNEASRNSRSFFADRPGSLASTAGTLVVDGTNPFGVGDAAAVAAYRNLFANVYRAPLPPSASSLVVNGDGTIFARNTGSNLRDAARYGYVADEAGIITQRSVFDSTIQLPLERYTAFGRGEFEVSPGITIYGQFNYATYKTDQLSDQGTFQTIVDPIRVPASNPFVTPDLRIALNARRRPNDPVLYYFTGTRAGRLRVVEDYDVYQFLGGVKGKITDTSLNYDVYASYGETDQTESTFNQYSRSRLNTLLQAPDGGRSVCDGGYNPFGYEDVSESCKAYLLRNSTNLYNYKQTVVQANLSGNLFTLPGGDAGFAVGAEYRKNSFEANIDPANQPVPSTVNGATTYAAPETLGLSGSGSSSGNVAVKEVYAEVLLPLLRDTAFAQSLELDLAYRYSDYNRVGGVHTYKAGLNWTPVRGITARGGYSRAIRAPGLGELFAPRAGVSGTIGSPATGTGDPCDSRSAARAGRVSGVTPGQVEALCIAQGVPSSLYSSYAYTGTLTAAFRVGNPDLKEETADSYTVGVVVQPEFAKSLFRNLSFSVDYYNIKLDDAIGRVTSQVALQQCFNFGGQNPSFDPTNSYCALINRDAAGLLAFINEPQFNLGSYSTSGLDFQFDATVDAGNAGAFSLNSFVSYVLDYKIQTLPSDPTFDYAGTIGNLQIDGYSQSHPAWKAATTLSWFGDLGSLSLRWRFIDAMGNSANVGVANGSAPGVPSVNYFDLIGRLKAGEGVEFRAGVTNLTDKQPPVFGGPASTDFSTYDVIGRRYFLGVTKRF